MRGRTFWLWVLLFILALKAYAFSDRTIFLTKDAIEVEYESGHPKIFRGGHDEKYHVRGKNGKTYKLRIRDPNPLYAEFAMNIVLEAVGLTSPKMYPVLLQRGRNGVPDSATARRLFSHPQVGTTGGRPGEVILGTLQEFTQLDPWKPDQLSAEQTADLMGHLILHYIFGNNDIQLGENIAQSNGSIVTLDSTQSFKFYSQRSDRDLTKFLWSFPRNRLKEFSKPQLTAFADRLNEIISRLEKIPASQIKLVLAGYSNAENQRRKFANPPKPDFDFIAEFQTRVHSVRANLVSYFHDVAKAAADNLAKPIDTKPAEIELPNLVRTENEIPSARGRTKQELAWVYYFGGFWKNRDAIIRKWAIELGEPPEAVMTSVLDIQTTPSRSPSEPAPLAQTLKPTDSAHKEAQKYLEQGLQIGRTFEPEIEFPNLFLRPEFRTLNPELIPADEVRRAEKLTGRALQSVFRRMTVKIVPHGESKARPIRYFEYIQSQVASRLREAGVTNSDNIQLMPSGGVIRSARNYLYKRMHEGLIGEPPQSTEETLDQIINETEDLPATDVRGTKSDLDVLVRTKDGKPIERFDIIEKCIGGITFSSKKKYGRGRKRDSVSEAVFERPDVQDYELQITRSVRQGGSTVDLLAFDIEDAKFISPKTHPTISADIVRGIFDYLPPEIGSKRDDPMTTTTRIIRTYFDTPWLRLRLPLLPNDEQIRKELQSVIDDIKSGKITAGNPDFEKTIKQFRKATRNSLHCAGRNRLFRAKAGSIEALLMEFARTAQRLLPAGEEPLIPEFTDFRPISKQARSPLAKDLPPELLLTVDDFLAKHTGTNSRGQKGLLYHGTPSIDGAFAILKQGLLLSKTGQGTAAYGRGAYSTPSFRVASGYAHRGDQGGVVLALQVRSDLPLVILDWDKAETENRAFVSKVNDEARTRGVEPFEILSRDYGVDIVIHHHVLIQNAQAVHFPEGLRGLAKTLSYDLETSATFKDEKLERYSEKFLEYASLYAYFQDTGENVSSLKPPVQLLEIILLKEQWHLNEIFTFLKDPFVCAVLAQSERLEEIARVFNGKWDSQYLESQEEPSKRASISEVFDSYKAFLSAGDSKTQASFPKADQIFDKIVSKTHWDLEEAMTFVEYNSAKAAARGSFVLWIDSEIKKVITNAHSISPDELLKLYNHYVNYVKKVTSFEFKITPTHELLEAVLLHPNWTLGHTLALMPKLKNEKAELAKDVPIVVDLNRIRRFVEFKENLRNELRSLARQHGEYIGGLEYLLDLRDPQDLAVFQELAKGYLNHSILQLRPDQVLGVRPGMEIGSLSAEAFELSVEHLFEKYPIELARAGAFVGSIRALAFNCRNNTVTMEVKNSWRRPVAGDSYLIEFGRHIEAPEQMTDDDYAIASLLVHSWHHEFTNALLLSGNKRYLGLVLSWFEQHPNYGAWIFKNASAEARLVLKDHFKDQFEWKNDFRKVIAEAYADPIYPAATYNGAGYYPWSPNDPEDILLLNQMASTSNPHQDFAKKFLITHNKAEFKLVRAHLTSDRDPGYDYFKNSSLLQLDLKYVHRAVESWTPEQKKEVALRLLATLDPVTFGIGSDKYRPAYFAMTLAPDLPETQSFAAKAIVSGQSELRDQMVAVLTGAKEPTYELVRPAVERIHSWSNSWSNRPDIISSCVSVIKELGPKIPGFYDHAIEALAGSWADYLEESVRLDLFAGFIPKEPQHIKALVEMALSHESSNASKQTAMQLLSRAGPLTGLEIYHQLLNALGESLYPRESNALKLLEKHEATVSSSGELRTVLASSASSSQRAGAFIMQYLRPETRLSGEQWVSFMMDLAREKDQAVRQKIINQTFRWHWNSPAENYVRQRETYSVFKVIANALAIELVWNDIYNEYFIERLARELAARPAQCADLMLSDKIDKALASVRK